MTRTSACSKATPSNASRKEAPQTEWTYADPIGENWGSVLAQDFSNMQFVQKGMKSSGFRGPLPNPHQEQKVINLHRNLANFMGGRGRRPSWTSGPGTELHTREFYEG
ncbi:hypothetical protein ACFSLT_11005 [Novosphingobium resinovorum]